MDATPRTTPRKSATFDDYSLSEIRHEVKEVAQVVQGSVDRTGDPRAYHGQNDRLAPECALGQRRQGDGHYLGREYQVGLDGTCDLLVLQRPWVGGRRSPVNANAKRTPGECR